MVSKAAQELGKKGGQAKSEKKTAAVRENAKKPRGKWVTGVAYQFEDVSGDAVWGLILMQGKWYPETTAGFPQTKKMLEDHSGKKMLSGSSQLDVEHLLVK